MPKSLSSIWLKSMKRMGRAQQAQQAQGRKFFLSLLPPVLGQSPKRRAKTPKILKLVKTVLPLALDAARPPKVTRVARPRPARIAKSPAVVKPVRAPATAGRWKSFYYACGEFPHARRMMYWLYLPPSLPAEPGSGPRAPMPLVVMLHGCEQSATDFATSTRMNALADRKGFAVLYPQQSADADAHRCWHWYKRPTQEGLGDVRLIAGMIGHVQARHGLDASRTYVAGLSAGAGLASILALRHPSLVAAVGLHSAPVFGTTDSPLSAYGVMQHGSAHAHTDAAHAVVKDVPDFPGMPVMLVHGGGDTVVRPVNMQHLAGQFAIINGAVIGGAQPVERLFPARSGGRAPRHGYRITSWYAGRKPQLVKCEIDTLGHAWSGGDASVPFSEPLGPDATLLMWTFFEKHQRLQHAAGKAVPLVETA